MKSRHPILASGDDGDYIKNRIRELPALFEEFFETLADAMDLEQELRAKGVVVMTSAHNNNNNDQNANPSGSSVLSTASASVDTMDNPLSAFSKSNEEMRRQKVNDSGILLNMDHLIDDQQEWGTVLVTGSAGKSRLVNLSGVTVRAVTSSSSGATDSPREWRLAKDSLSLGLGRVAVSNSTSFETEDDTVHLLQLRIQAAKLFTCIRCVTSELEEIPATTFRIVSASTSSEKVNSSLTQILSKIVLLWNGDTGIHLNERALSWSKPLLKLGQDAANQLDCTVIRFSYRRRLKRDLTSPSSPITYLLKLVAILSIIVLVVTCVAFAIVPPGAYIAVTVSLTFGLMTAASCVLLIVAYTATLSALSDMLNEARDTDLTGGAAAAFRRAGAIDGVDVLGADGSYTEFPLTLNRQIQKQRRESRFGSQGGGVEDNDVHKTRTNVVQVKSGATHSPQDSMDVGDPISMGADPSAFGSVQIDSGHQLGNYLGIHGHNNNNSSGGGGHNKNPVLYQAPISGGTSFQGGEASGIGAPHGTDSAFFPLFYNIPGVGGLPPGHDRAFVDCRFIDAQLVMIGFDDQFNVVLWNAAAEAATGFLESEVLGKPMIELLETPYPDFESLTSDDEERSAIKIQLKVFSTTSIHMFAICAPVVVSRQQYQSYKYSQSQSQFNQSSSRASASKHSQNNQQVLRAGQQRGYRGVGGGGTQGDDLFGSTASSLVHRERGGSNSENDDTHTIGHVLLCAAGKDNLHDANHYVTNYFASQLALNLRRAADEGTIQYRQDRQNMASLVDFASRGNSSFIKQTAEMLVNERWQWCSGPQLLSRGLRAHLNKCEAIPLSPTFPASLCINLVEVSNCVDRIVEFSPTACRVSLEIRMDRARNVSVLVATFKIVNSDSDSKIPDMEPTISNSDPTTENTIFVGGASTTSTSTASPVVVPSILKKPPSTPVAPDPSLANKGGELSVGTPPPVVLPTQDDSSSESPKRVMISEGTAGGGESRLSPLERQPEGCPLPRKSKRPNALSGSVDLDDSGAQEATFDLASMLLPGGELPRALSKCFGIIFAMDDDTVLEFTAPCQLASYHMTSSPTSATTGPDSSGDHPISDRNDNSYYDDFGGGPSPGGGGHLDVSSMRIDQASVLGVGSDSLMGSTSTPQGIINSKITCTVHVMTMITNMVDQHNLSIVLLNTPFVALTNLRQMSDLDSKIRTNDVDIVVADKNLYWQAKTMLQDRLDVFLVPLMPANAPRDLLAPYMLRTPIDRPSVLALMEEIGMQVEGKKRTQKDREDRERILASRQDSPWTQGKLLGRGACGVVYEATSDLTGGRMAVKMFYFKKTNDMDKEITIMLQEIKIMCSLNHPNIVHYFYCERKDPNLNLFMELCDGSLTDYLNKQKQHINNTDLTAMTTNVIVEQILRALVYLHDQGITHRDIKPQNILLKGNVVKMTDFGTARQNKEEELLDVQGTFRYMAPEVYRGQPHSQSCDIWSLGCLTAELLGSPLNFMEPRNYTMLGEMVGVDMPTSLRGEARDFVEQCLNMIPSSRPRASMLLLHPFVTSQSEVQTLLSFADAQARPGGKRDSIASRASAFSLSSAASKVSKASRGRM